MSLQRVSKYGHLVVVVYKCGFKITKTLLLKRIEELTPAGHDPYPWTVDHFLYKNRKTILEHKFGKDNERTLYPGFNKPTDTEVWDINTFCLLLVNFCGLDAAVKQDIKMLRMLRNELAHPGERDIHVDNFFLKTKLDIIEGIIDRCSKVIGKPELKEELTCYIKEINAIQQADVSEGKAKLKKWLEEEKTYKIWITFSKALDKFRAQLPDLQEIREGNGQTTSITFSTSILVEFIDAEKPFKEVLDTTLDDSRMEPVSEAMSKIEKVKDDIREFGPEVEGTSCGSIMFKITCSSVSSMIYLIDYFNGPILQRRLYEIVQALYESCDDMFDDLLTVQISIPEEIQRKIIEKLEESTSSDEYEPLSKKMKVSKNVFNDPLYGQIELHPLCVKVIDTPQFQRLRYIKQLDTCYFVYPGASHNRFEHSIGVCHLAGKLLRLLKERQPELDITTKDILCVEISALCHDLGQGPFSHIFEHKFMPAIDPNSTWKHERSSVEMFEYMLQDKGKKLENLLRGAIPGFEDRDIQFIKEIIDVPEYLKKMQAYAKLHPDEAEIQTIIALAEETSTNQKEAYLKKLQAYAKLRPDDAEIQEILAESRKEWPFTGRGKDKSFLYEVVANHVNGIDVDRWDYISRDSYMLGMKSVFDHNRCIHHARVIKADGRKQICYRDKAAQDLYDMFYSRMALYRRAYQHKTHNIIGLMVRDALLAANEKIVFIGEEGKRLHISETIKDMKAFTHLTDDILQQIHRSEDKDLENARVIINRIVDRQFYKCITQTQVDVKKKGWIVKTEVQQNLFNKINQRLDEPRDLSDIIEIDVVNLDYGSKEKDPIANVWFFKKGQEEKPIRISKEQVSFVLPDTFAEQYIRVYCSVTDPQLFDVIEKSFSEWCQENDVPQPKGG